MKYLVYCPCGHTLDRHEASGCGGYGSSCDCCRCERGALDAAIDLVAATRWYALDGAQHAWRARDAG